MYHITLTVGNETLILDHGHGYDIATIDGLTGVTARLDTAQSNTDLGVAVQSGSVGGQKLVVRGYILDHNVEAKQALISLLKPMARGTIVLYNLPSGTGRLTPYRQTDFVVQTTPKITQTKHAKFSFELLQPNPTWRAMEASRIVLPTNTYFDPVTATVDGETKADYSWIVYVNAPIKTLTLDVRTFDAADEPPHRAVLSFDFASLNADGVTGTVNVWRKDGKLTATLDSTDIIPYLALSHYMLDGLREGENEFRALATLNDSAVECLSMLTYSPSYVGVVLSGI